MPRTRINLKDRRVAAAVLALLVLIIGVNARTILPALGLGRGQVSQADQPQPVPEDLETVAQAAAAHLAAGGTGGVDLAAITAGGAPGAPSGVRDPFRRQSRRGAGSAGRPVASRRQPEPLKCTAVLLGGRIPTALINGKSYHPGQKVRDYEVVRIDNDGVLVASGPKMIFLPVGSPDPGAACYPPVGATGPAGGGD